MGMLPGIGKIKKQMTNAKIDDKMLKRQIADHLVDDAEGARQPGRDQGLAQAAHRQGLRASTSPT